MHGIFNINKPSGMTSHDVVGIVRKISGATRVGHAGTLDPLATGVLLVCVGQAVRISEYLVDHDKKYRARIRLGVETDTYDATGAVVAQRDVSAPREQVENTLRSFIGRIQQYPPAYSAIKQKGTPLYKLARRGEHVETQPREIEIFSIELRELKLPEIEFDLHCSKGTYVRSIAHDLGEKLGCGAHLTALTRLASGTFTLDHSIALDPLREAIANGTWQPYLIPFDQALQQFESVTVDAQTAQRIKFGQSFVCDREFSSPLLRVYTDDGGFVALVERADSGNAWKPKKVFIEGQRGLEKAKKVEKA